MATAFAEARKAADGSAAKEGTDAEPDARTEHGELLALHVGIGDNASALFNVSSTPWTMR